MKSLMELALGEDWSKLPPALQAHYRFGATTEIGHMDIEYPRFMQPILSLLRLLGALVNRGGSKIFTRVEKWVVGDRQFWRRTFTYPDGAVAYFNSYFIAAGKDQLVEFVNPVLGLKMVPSVKDGQLHYSGVSFVVRLGPVMLAIPEWLLLGHTTIVEVGIDDTHFAMDFRLTHPLFGQVFRYAGLFEADTGHPNIKPQ